MNQKQAKKIRKLLKQTPSSDGSEQSRYNNIKKNWEKIPHNQKKKLMEALQNAANLISDNNQSNP